MWNSCMISFSVRALEGETRGPSLKLPSMQDPLPKKLELSITLGVSQT